MKLVRTAALSRQHSPPWVCLSRAERIKLRTLPHLARCAFEEIVGLSDFDTGKVQTSRPVLLSLLDFDQGTGPNASQKPTEQMLRTAIDQLWAAGLLLGRRERVSNANKAERCLFFRVQSRKRIIASMRLINQQFNQSSTEGKRGSKQPVNQPGVHNPISLSPTSLSHARPVDKPTYTQRQMQARMSAARHP